MKRSFVVGLGLLLFPALLSATDWWESCKIKGDLRYRHEMIDTEGRDARHRQRVRARIGIEGQVSDMTNVRVQLATGSDDPVSTNQTLDNGFSTKPIMLNLAYFEIKPQTLPGFIIQGGKFHNPFFKPGSSELLWDSDLNPEGGLLSWQTQSEPLSLRLIGSGLWIDERSSDKDSWMAAGQGILVFNLKPQNTKVSVGGGFFDFVNAAGYTAFFDGEPMGNSVDSLDRYLNDYEIVELFLEASRDFEKIPVTVMADFATNTATDSLNQGWLVGACIGKAKKPGSWSIRYVYREVQKDAVVGSFTDSDFRGGGTDAKGHEIGGCLQLAHNTTFGVTYFSNKIGLERPEEDFGRLQVDLQLNF